MGETKEIGNNIKFDVQSIVEVPPTVLDAAQKAISMVWQQNVGEPITVSLVVASRIVDQRGKDTGWSSEYDPDLDAFKFAIDTIKERVKFGLSDEDTILLLAAHEAKHKVQFYIGDPPRSSPKGYLMDNKYNNDRHEKEAWEEALHVFKKLYPEAQGRFETGGRWYEIPNKSRY